MPARFTPLARASRAQRATVLVVGPLLWLAAVIFVGVIVDRGNAVEIGLVVALVAFVLSLLVSALARRRRLREEREAVTS